MQIFKLNFLINQIALLFNRYPTTIFLKNYDCSNI
jgi:hypothetical protein